MPPARVQWYQKCISLGKIRLELGDVAGDNKTRVGCQCLNIGGRRFAHDDEASIRQPLMNERQYLTGKPEHARQLVGQNIVPTCRMVGARLGRCATPRYRVRINRDGNDRELVAQR